MCFVLVTLLQPQHIDGHRAEIAILEPALLPDRHGAAEQLGRQGGSLRAGQGRVAALARRITKGIRRSSRKASHGALMNSRSLTAR